MDIFNGPDARETATSGASRTNTPLQALVTMTNPQFFFSRGLAQPGRAGPLETLREIDDTSGLHLDRVLARVHSNQASGDLKGAALKDFPLLLTNPIPIKRRSWSPWAVENAMRFGCGRWSLRPGPMSPAIFNLDEALNK